MPKVIPRLIDDIRDSGKLGMPHWVTKVELWEKHTAVILEILCTEKPRVFRIDGVADDYFTVSDQEYWDLTQDFPSLEPPSPLAWFEYRMSGVIRSRVHGDTDLAPIVEGRVGLLMIGSERADVVGEGIPAEVRWVLTFELFLDYGGGDIQGPHGAIHIFVDAAGRIVDRPWMQTFMADGSAGITDLIAFVHPALLAFERLVYTRRRRQRISRTAPTAKRSGGRTSSTAGEHGNGTKIRPV